MNVARCVVWNVVCCERCSSDIARIGSCDLANDAAHNNCMHWCLRSCKWCSAQELRASLQLILREVLQAFTVACDIAKMMLGSYVASYTAFKKHALAPCRTMPTVWAVGCYAAFDVNKSHGACCVPHVLYTKQNSLRFFPNLVTLVVIAVMVQCLDQEYGSSKLLQKCLVSRISPFSSTPAHKLAEDSSVNVPSHYRSGWKEMYR